MQQVKYEISESQGQLLVILTSFKSVFIDMYCIQDSNLISGFPCYNKVSLLKLQPIMQGRYYFSLQGKRLVGKLGAILLSLLPTMSCKIIAFRLE